MRHKLTGKQRINIKIFGHKKISGYPPASACTWWRVLASWDASSPRAADDIKCTIKWAAPNYRRTIQPTLRGVSAGVAFRKWTKPGSFANNSNQNMLAAKVAKWQNQNAAEAPLPPLPSHTEIFIWALIWYWDHLKIFFAEIPQGPSGMSIGTIWVTQKRSQGPPARGFWLF